MSVAQVAMYCQIELCVSQPQLALAFRLALHMLKIGIFISHRGGSGSSLPYRHNIIITHGKDIIILSNSSKSRLALHFENPIFTNCRRSSLSCDWQCTDSEDTLSLSQTC